MVGRMAGQWYGKKLGGILDLFLLFCNGKVCFSHDYDPHPVEPVGTYTYIFIYAKYTKYNGSLQTQLTIKKFDFHFYY